MPRECVACGEEIKEDIEFDGKYDPRRGVYADDYAYHLGCEDEVIEEVLFEI